MFQNYFDPSMSLNGFFEVSAGEHRGWHLILWWLMDFFFFFYAIPVLTSIVETGLHSYNAHIWLQLGPLRCFAAKTMRFLKIYQSTCTHDAVLSWDPLNFSDPQSIDEIFSITIAASLREEGATLTGVHCWFPVPVLWIYKHLLSSYGCYNCNSWPIVLSCQHAKAVVVVMTTFWDKTVSAAWIPSTEYNPKVTLGIRVSFLSFFLSFFFFFCWSVEK